MVNKEEKAFNVFIENIEMECPLCGEIHNLELRKRPAKLIIKGKIISYEELYYYCSKSEEDENEFVSSKLNKQNLLNARDEYRKYNGLLTSMQIVQIREQYGLSQLDLAILLDWGEVTITRYEGKAIQDEAHDNVLRIIKDNPLKAHEYLEKNKLKFKQEKYCQIKENIIDKLDAFGKEYLSRQKLECIYVRYSEPSYLNGNTTLSIDKVESIIAYFAKNVKNLYKVKLMKLLWYADSLNYKKYGIAMTGLVYEHNDMGALPLGHNEIMGLEHVNVEIEDSYDFTKYHFLPNETLDISVLSSKELNILDKVIQKFRDDKAKDIVLYMHDEIAYKETGKGEIISFNLSKEIRTF